ncbi:MAG: hypothetical protein ABI588_09975 [Arenimonas sp.]
MNGPCDESPDSKAIRAPYERPELVAYGQLRALTTAGSKGVLEMVAMTATMKQFS